MREYKDRGVVILGISIDDPADTLRAYAAKKRMDYPVLLMQDDVDRRTGPIFGVPVTFFIGRDGKISKRAFRSGHEGAGGPGDQGAPVV